MDDSLTSTQCGMRQRRREDEMKREGVSEGGREGGREREREISLSSLLRRLKEKR